MVGFSFYKDPLGWMESTWGGGGRWMGETREEASAESGCFEWLPPHCGPVPLGSRSDLLKRTNQTGPTLWH